ncbi:MAG: hypothetical protein V3U11_09810 [Planctomycetota bacterium]
MIAAGWLVRLLIYIPVMFLILVVFLGQKHDNAADTLRESVRKTLKWVGWTIVLVLVMQVCFWAFVD